MTYFVFACSVQFRRLLITAWPNTSLLSFGSRYVSATVESMLQLLVVMLSLEGGGGEGLGNMKVKEENLWSVECFSIMSCAHADSVNNRRGCFSEYALILFVYYCTWRFKTSTAASSKLHSGLLSARPSFCTVRVRHPRDVLIMR